MGNAYSDVVIISRCVSFYRDKSVIFGMREQTEYPRSNYSVVSRFENEIMVRKNDMFLTISNGILSINICSVENLPLLSTTWYLLNFAFNLLCVEFF